MNLSKDKLKILVLTRYGTLGASSRLRFAQYFKYLNRSQFEIEYAPLIDDEDLADRYKNGAYSFKSIIKSYFKRFFTLLKINEYDILWVEKEVFPWLPSGIELFFLKKKPFIIDFDDAVFHNYDLASTSSIKFILGSKFQKILPQAALVVAGNDYLSDKLKSFGAREIEIIPTVVDINRYDKKKYGMNRGSDFLPKIVWIGSLSTVKYLELIKKPLFEAYSKSPFVLQVIGAHFEFPEIQVELKAWSLESEVIDISECDIGIMPLKDSDWERGKCGYKLIQYMACGLPVIASPIGVNKKIITKGLNGYLASNDQEWAESLVDLLRDFELRQSMGSKGRLIVENNYCIQVTEKKIEHLFHRFSIQKVK